MSAPRSDRFGLGWRPALAASILSNLERAAHVVGRPPLVENGATLVDPPGSTMDEGAFVASAAGLPAADLDALERIDRDGLILAAESFRKKRAFKDAHAPSSLLSSRFRRS